MRRFLIEAQRLNVAVEICSGIWNVRQFVPPPKSMLVCDCPWVSRRMVFWGFKPVRSGP
jgi:hypothetical protein